MYNSSREYWRLRRRCETHLGKVQPSAARAQAFEDRHDWISSLQRAATLARQGKYEESLPWYERAIQQNPGEPGTGAALDSAVIDRGKVLLALGRVGQARREVSRRLRGEDPRLRAFLQACDEAEGA